MKSRNARRVAAEGGVLCGTHDPMAQLTMDGMDVTAPRRHRGPIPVYGARARVTARIDESADDVLRRAARAAGESYSALVARILEREAERMTA